MAIKIMLDDKYYLTSDRRNYTIAYDTVSKSGKASVEYWGHYGTLSGAFEGFTDLKIRLSDATSWKEVKALLVDLSRLYQNIQEEIYRGTNEYPLNKTYKGSGG